MTDIFKTTALAMLLLGIGASGASAAGLDAFGWKNRVLVVFAKPGDPAAAEQRRLLIGDKQALAERDMVVLDVLGDTVSPVFGQADGVTAAELRNDAAIKDGSRFTVILVGKDGGIKLRATRPVAPDQLFGLIDSMPMRANEASR